MKFQNPKKNEKIRKIHLDSLLIPFKGGINPFSRSLVKVAAKSDTGTGQDGPLAVLRASASSGQTFPEILDVSIRNTRYVRLDTRLDIYSTYV